MTGDQSSTMKLKLPIDDYKNEILQLINFNDVSIVESCTGSGKTIRIPQFILSNDKNCRIAITQPRRIAVTTAAERVALEQNTQVGKSIVGYEMAMDHKVQKDTKIIFMTTGTLTHLLINEKTETPFTHLIIDEVHVRDIHTDLLLLIINNLLQRKKMWKIKIILLSATINALDFLNYFSHRRVNHLPIKSQQLQYPMTCLYLLDIQQKMNIYAFQPLDPEEVSFSFSNFEGVAELLKRLPEYDVFGEKGSVLIFLPGVGEIHSLHEALDSRNKDNINCWKIKEMHSNVSDCNQRQLFLPREDNNRSIILATNIAESSVTLSTIRYVIDFCLTKRQVHDNDTNSTCLELHLASRHQCIQRSGRTGRTCPGIVFRIIDQDIFDKLDEQSPPKMKTSGLALVFLWLKQLHIGSPMNILKFAMNPPDEPNILSCVESLKEVGALTIDMKDGSYQDYNGEMTVIGELSANLSIDPRLARLIALGHVFGLMEEAITLAAIMTNKTIFNFPRSTAGNQAAWSTKLRFCNDYMSDSVASINAYKYYQTRRASMDCAEDMHNNYLKLAVLKNVENDIQKFKRKICNAFNGTSSVGYSPYSKNFELIMQIFIAATAFPDIYLRTRISERRREKYANQVYSELKGCDPNRSVYIVPHFCHDPPNQDQLFELERQFHIIAGTIQPPFVKWEPTHGHVVAQFHENEEKFDKILSCVYTLLKIKVHGFKFMYTTFDNNHMESTGPFSPLYMPFKSFMKCIDNNIVQDRDSVASVAIDDQFPKSVTYVISGLKISKSKQKKTIIIKEGTRLEPIDGMFSLLNLLFAPRILLRPKSNGQGYTSCLSGLGLKPSTTATAFTTRYDYVKFLEISPQRYTECLFDINVNNQVIKRINALRMLMDDLLSPTNLMKDTEYVKSNRVFFLDCLLLLFRSEKGTNSDRTSYPRFKWKELKQQQQPQRPETFLLFPPHSIIE